METLEIISDFMDSVDLETLNHLEIAKNFVAVCNFNFNEYQTKILVAALDAGLNTEEVVNGEYSLYDAFDEKLEIISDFMDSVNGIDYCGTYSLAENFVALCDLNFSEEQTTMLAAALDAGLNAENAVEIIANGECCLYDAFDYEELGEEILFDKLQGDRFLEHLAPFIDYERYGQIYCRNNCCYFTKYGVLEVF